MINFSKICSKQDVYARLKNILTKIVLRLSNDAILSSWWTH